MRVPLGWLGDYIDVAGIGAARLADTLTMAGLEVEEIEGDAAGGNGAVYITKVTPNRGDWLSVRGTAREALAALSVWDEAGQRGAYARAGSRLPAAPLPAGDLGVPVRIDAPGDCPRYSAAVIDVPGAGTSPAWLQQRLVAAGLRPINAVVDATNYVMLELGQPLHAFDLATLAGPEIVVRRARADERIVTLDGKERALDSRTLVIADRDDAVAVAGVMGGGATEVSEATRRVLLESAHFDPPVVRAGAKRLGMSTDASYRFERGVDPSGTLEALTAAARLIADLTGGRVAPGVADVYPAPAAPRRIALREARAVGLLGAPPETLRPALRGLTALGFAVEEDAAGAVVAVAAPTLRPDIAREIDVIEEIGRMIGYDKLPATLPPARAGHGGGRDSDAGEFVARVRALLVGQGLDEVYSHTLGAPSPFDDPEEDGRRVRVRSALSAELSGLRQSLVPGLLETLGRNARQRATGLALFEIGSVFSAEARANYAQEPRVAAVLQGDYTVAKGMMESLLAALHLRPPHVTAGRRPGMHPNRTAVARLGTNEPPIGFVAEVDPDSVAEHLDLPVSFGRVACFELRLEPLYALLPSAASYFPLPKFPETTRDLAMVFDRSVEYAGIEAAARVAAGEYAESVALASIYTGERVGAGKKSVALRFTLRAPDRTLTDADADAAIAAARAALEAQLGATLR